MSSKHKHLLLLALPLLLMAKVFLLSQNTYAATNAWHQPLWNGHITSGQSYPNNSYTTLGCDIDNTGDCGYFLKSTDTDSSSGAITTQQNRSITMISLKPDSGSSANLKSKWVVFTVTASARNASNYYSPIMSFQGATKIMPNYVSNRKFYTPVAVLSEQTWTSLDSTSSLQYGNTSLTIIASSTNTDPNGTVVIPVHLYLPYAGETAKYINVTSATFYNDLADLLAEQNATQKEILNVLQQLNLNGIKTDNSDITDQQQEFREQDQQDMQDAQDDSQNAGDSSSQEASDTGQTLLQAFISFVGAIASATPSNCNINMNTGFIDFGIVDLCQLNPPPAFQVISSIVVIGFAVPLSISASKKMIELFRSFQ